MNILIIGGSGNAPSANSVCVRNMAQEFIRRGHKVWNLAAGDDYVTKPGNIGGAELWQIPDDYYMRLTKSMARPHSCIKKLWYIMVSLFRHIVLLLLYPMTEPIRANKVLNKAEQLVQKEGINLIIAIHNNYTNINAGIKLKKRYGSKLMVVDYHLDLRTASLNTSKLIQSYVRKHSFNSIANECQIVDKILIPYSGQAEIEELKGIDLRKFRFVGLPVFIKEPQIETCDLPFKKDAINISYIGSLSLENRNPSYVIGLLEKASEMIGKKIIAHFWGDADGMENMINRTSIALYHGMVESRYVSYIMAKSDFLLNIGNAIAYNMLPSKVFGMFATGKPVINVITHPKDATIPYFKRYNHSVDLKEYSPLQEDIVMLADGIKKMSKEPLRDADNLFDDFKPETICDIVLK